MYNDYDFSYDDVDYDEINYTKSTKRAVRRKLDFSKAKRKQRLARLIYGEHSWYNNLHQYSKNKIHCSCPLCAFNHKAHGYVNYSIADLKNFEKMNSQESEYFLDT